MAQDLKTRSIETRIIDRTARIAVVGLGFVGLPLAVEFARRGFTVTGCDVDGRKIEAMRHKRFKPPDISESELARLTDEKRLTPVESLDGDYDVFVICVPTPLGANREPDLGYLRSAARMVAPVLHDDQLVVVESTSYPGTVEEVILPILSEGGLTAGEDYCLGYSPERIDPGNKEYDIHTTPKVVAGLTDNCREATMILYGQIVDNVVPVSSIRAAEMTKLLENVFRTVNIALVNELAILAEKLDLNIWEIVDAAATKPFGFMKFLPGPGLGGHCLPVDPIYLSWKAKEVGFYTEFIELAGKTNDAMPAFVVRKLTNALNSLRRSVNGSKILMLGVSYKNDVGDVRESPALKIIRLLHDLGAEVSYHDPYVPELHINGSTIVSRPWSREALESADVVMILTAHSDFDYGEVADCAKLVVDTRNAMAEYTDEKIVTL